MPFVANVFKLMITSPGDVAEERRIVTEEVHGWNDVNASTRQIVLLPVKWETHSTPEHGAHPQTIINRQLLEDADILVAIFGIRIGTPTKEHVSGTVEEVKKHLASGKTAKIYFSNVPVSPDSIDREQYASVQEFKKECQENGLYSEYKTPEQFRKDFRRHLEVELNKSQYHLSPPREPPGRSNHEPVGGVAPDQDTKLSVKAFDQQKLAHVRSLLNPLQYFERDLLRFLLVNGDSRGDAISLAATNAPGGFELNSVSKTPVQRGLIHRTDSHLTGYSTFSLNPNLVDTLGILLFPRMEEKPSWFEGLDG
jgi:hypothetical protein